MKDLVEIYEDDLNENRNENEINQIKKLIILSKKALLKFDEMEALINEIELLDDKTKAEK